jgi:hypothetical protein
VDDGGLGGRDDEQVITGSCGCGRDSPASLIALAFVLCWFMRTSVPRAVKVGNPGSQASPGRSRCRY